ncbi:unnamed protein product [Arctogadus glacialis]
MEMLAILNCTSLDALRVPLLPSPHSHFGLLGLSAVRVHVQAVLYGGLWFGCSVMVFPKPGAQPCSVCKHIAGDGNMAAGRGWLDVDNTMDYKCWGGYSSGLGPLW